MYKDKKGKDLVQAEFRKQCDVFRDRVDFVLGEVGPSSFTIGYSLEVVSRYRSSAPSFQWDNLVFHDTHF